MSFSLLSLFEWLCPRPYNNGCSCIAKQWDYGTNAVVWRSVDGMYGIENTGRLSVVCGRERNVMKLATGYSVNMPIAGSTLERIMKPFVAYAFGVWLKRLSR